MKLALSVNRLVAVRAMEKDEPLGRREQNRRDRRQALIASARALFDTRSFEAVTIEEITARAGVSKRTFFRYFPTKEDVVFPEHEARLDRFRELVAGRLPGEDPLAGVRRAFVALGSQLMADRDEVIALQRVVDRSQALVASDRARDREWDEVVAAALADGREPSPAERMAAGAIMGALRAALRVWYEAEGEGDVVELGLQGFALLWQGLGTPADATSGASPAG